MKKYKITVNGQSYEVEVEEIGNESASSAPSITTQNPSKPVEASMPKAAAPKKSGAVGESKITSPMPGTIMTIKAKEGDKMQKGDVLMILEAMKMENEIIAPEDGVLISIDVAEGAAVDTGDILATFE